MGIHQITLETIDPDQHTGDATRAELARRLHADVGAPDEGLFDVRFEAGSREEALQRVADVLAEMGVEDHFTFPSTTGTGYQPARRARRPGRRAAVRGRAAPPAGRQPARQRAGAVRPAVEGRALGATRPASAAAAPAGSARPGSPVPSGPAAGAGEGLAAAAAAGWARAPRRCAAWSSRSAPSARVHAPVPESGWKLLIQPCWSTPATRSATGTPTTAVRSGSRATSSSTPTSGRYLARDAPELAAQGLRVVGVAGAGAPPRRCARDADAVAPGQRRSSCGATRTTRTTRTRSRSTAGGEQVGWVPRELAAELAPELDAGAAVVGARAARAAPLAARPAPRADDAAGARDAIELRVGRRLGGVAGGAAGLGLGRLDLAVLRRRVGHQLAEQARVTAATSSTARRTPPRSPATASRSCRSSDVLERRARICPRSPGLEVVERSDVAAHASRLAAGGRKSAARRDSASLSPAIPTWITRSRPGPSLGPSRP